MPGQQPVDTPVHAPKAPTPTSCKPPARSFARSLTWLHLAPSCPAQQTPEGRSRHGRGAVGTLPGTLLPPSLHWGTWPAGRSPAAATKMQQLLLLALALLLFLLMTLVGMPRAFLVATWDQCPSRAAAAAAAVRAAGPVAGGQPAVLEVPASTHHPPHGHSINHDWPGPTGATMHCCSSGD